MVPVGAIVAAVVVALRAVAAAQNRQKDDGASRPAASVPISRGSSTFWQDSGAAGTLVYQAILLGCFLGLTSVAFEVRHPVPLVFGLLAGWLLFPAWVARSVLAPLGLVRLAYASAWLSRVTWRRDKPGGPALVAAWGLAQQEKPSPSAIAWVEQRLTGTRRALQGSGVVAYGLLEAAKGKLDSARDWLEAVLNFDPRVAPVHVRGLVERAFGPLLPPKLGPEVPALLGAAAQAQRDALYRELEERMDRMDERKKAQRALPVLEEWREVMALRGLYQHAVNGGGPAERSLAFSIVRDKAVNYGVWLYNERAEKPVANAVFRWLEAEAVALGDAESERLNKKNAACDL